MRKFKGNGLLILAMAWMGTEKQQELLIAEHGFKLDQFNNDGSITIPSENGEITCKLNDYLMKVNGAYTAASPESFEETYKELEEGSEEAGKCDGNPVSEAAAEIPVAKEEAKTDTKVTEDSSDKKEVEVKENVAFGKAIAALHEGKRVARAGWNGKGLFVFMQVPATIGAEIVPKMQSLPDSVKAEFARRFATQDKPHEINYSNQMALVNPDNTINGWAPSSTDTLATDWCILD